MSTLIVEVVVIDNIINHPNADRLDIAKVKGWECVVTKGTYNPGDKAIYIPIDSVLGEPTLGILFPPESKIKPHNGRIKTAKIRGAYSQGMLADLVTLSIPYETKVGTDLAKKLNITKYEPPAPKVGGHTFAPAAKKKECNPNFKKYTAIENIKNFNKMFADGEEVVITEKIHGSNFRAGYVPVITDTIWKKILKYFGRLPKYEFVYGSHNVQLKNSTLNDFEKAQTNLYSEAVSKYNIRDILKEGEVVYGEVYGDGVQDGYNYGCPKGEHKLIIFDLMVDGKYVNTNTLKDWCERHGLDMVPILYQGSYSVEIAKQLTQGPSVLCTAQKVREGIVIKPIEETVVPGIARKVLKFVSDEYLCLKGNTDFH